MAKKSASGSKGRVEVYFVSYARLDDESGRLEKVSKDLASRVAMRLGHGHNELAFFDKTSMETGQDWEKRIRASVSSVQLLVCFCSNTFLNSEYCAREFDVFRRRLGQKDVPNTVRPIIPVIWDRCDLPQALLRFQLTKNPPKGYTTDGVLALHRLKGQKAAYDKTLAMLTEAIEKALSAGKLPPWRKPLGFDELADAFDNPGEGNVQIVALHPDRMRWVLAPGMTLRRAVEQVTATLCRPWRSLRADTPAKFQADVDAANQQGHAIVVVADADAIKASPWREYLDIVGQMTAPNLRVLVANDTFADPPDTLPRLPIGADVFQFDDVDVFQRALNAAIGQIEMAMLAQRTPARVESASLSQAAAKDGINLSAPPVLNNSGEQS